MLKQLIQKRLTQAASFSLMALIFFIVIEVPIVITYIVVRFTAIFAFTVSLMVLWELIKILIKKVQTSDTSSR